MANRIDTFRMLRDTYVKEVQAKLADERNLDAEIKVLETQLELKRAARLSLIADRESTLAQLAGIRAVIRGMEDRTREEARRTEDASIMAHRAIEDDEYGKF